MSGMFQREKCLFINEMDEVINRLEINIKIIKFIKYIKIKK